MYDERHAFFPLGDSLGRVDMLTGRLRESRDNHEQNNILNNSIRSSTRAAHGATESGTS